MPDLIDVSKGSEVLYRGRQATVVRHVSLEQALIKFEDGSYETVRLSALGRRSSSDEVQSLNEIPMEAYSEQNIDLAKKRLAVIQPIIEDPANKPALVKEASERTGLSISTIYRWLQKHEISPRLTSHISRASRKRKKRLGTRVERIIKDTISELYLKPKRVSQLRVIEEVKARCKSARLKVPHPNTIRSRIAELSERTKAKGRRGAKKARERHDAIKGRFPEGQLPLQCVQMDTQELHVHIVDSEERLEIGRPYLTLAVDTFSRMIVGYHLSLDAASAFTAGACVHHILLPKDMTLERLGVEGSWPVWGLPGNLHVDNGKDFRSKSLQRACEKHHITIEFRPPNFPHWAGCVESFFDTAIRITARRCLLAPSATVWELRHQLETTAMPLYLQSVTLNEVIYNVLTHADNYYAFRFPSELGAYTWVLDAKGRDKTTPWEDWWQMTVLAMLQSKTTRKPFMRAPGGDYSHHDRFNTSLPEYMVEHVTLGARSEVFDPRPIMTEDFRFSPDPEFGLEAVDVLTSCLRRSLAGNFSRPGWIRIREIMIHRRKVQYVCMLHLGSPLREFPKPRYSHVLKDFTKGGRSMLPKNYRDLAE
ncbi:DDE-type integrase/transposase/recombinase [Thalassospira sp.]|uniref:DDE-type integrase/transposase/recombinase n=1 Tax=Thalassospira sp. TaxID=1912094 RepID=UPI001B2913BC|nr:DDE-type integrase/transposase/recombinase [Thalassospira sp.]MBO6519205.1 transposase family protein [Rhodospirillales bacterium]MBO6773859.1 transposase family protein [Thalassospira sp.]